MMNEVQSLMARQSSLADSLVRPSPTGVAGAEPVPSRPRRTRAQWNETDLDQMVTTDHAPDVDRQIRMEEASR